MPLSKTVRKSSTKSRTSGGPPSSGRSTDELSSFLFSFSFLKPSTIPSSTSDDDASTTQTRPPILRVPLEVLERILDYTFLRRTKLTPSSDPYPLRNTTHLLLVSKAFRELCLPFFFHSITIGRPSDYVTFFHPETGILVAGEEGIARWRLVREICIGPNVEPETILPREHGKLWHAAYLLPLPENHIHTLCFLDAETDLAPSAASQVTGTDQQDEALLERRVEDGLRLEHQHADTGLELEQWMQASFGMSFEDAKRLRAINYGRVRNENTRNSVYSKLLQLGRQTPLLLILSTDPSRLHHLSSILSLPTLSLPSDLRIHRYVNPEPSSPSIVAEDPDLVSTFETIFQHLVLRYVHLEGFTTEDRPFFLDHLQKKENGPLRWLFCKESSADDSLVLVQAATLTRSRGGRRFERLSEQEQLLWRGMKVVAPVEESST